MPAQPPSDGQFRVAMYWVLGLVTIVLLAVTALIGIGIVWLGRAVL